MNCFLLNLSMRFEKCRMSTYIHLHLCNRQLNGFVCVCVCAYMDDRMNEWNSGWNGMEWKRVAEVFMLRDAAFVLRSSDSGISKTLLNCHKMKKKENAYQQQQLQQIHHWDVKECMVSMVKNTTLNSHTTFIHFEQICILMNHNWVPSSWINFLSFTSQR